MTGPPERIWLQWDIIDGPQDWSPRQINDSDVRYKLEPEPKGHDVSALLELERKKCKQDVCAMCAGIATGYMPPHQNSAGVWVHKRSNGGRKEFLCGASGIWAREHGERGDG